MLTFDFASYMENIAIKLKDISHSNTDKRFWRVSGISDLEDVLLNIRIYKGMQLVIEDNKEAGFVDRNTDNIIEQPYFSFYVLKKSRVTSMEDRTAAVNACLAATRKILSRMRLNKRHNEYGLQFLDFNSVRYSTVGPLGDNYNGIMCSFMLRDEAELFYNVEDWEE